MARKIPTYPKGRRALYPNGWPANMRAVLYLNQKGRKEGNGAFNPGQALQPNTVIVETTEMSNYG